MDRYITRERIRRSSPDALMIMSLLFFSGLIQIFAKDNPSVTGVSEGSTLAWAIAMTSGSLLSLIGMLLSGSMTLSYGLDALGRMAIIPNGVVYAFETIRHGHWQAGLLIILLCVMLLWRVYQIYVTLGERLRDLEFLMGLVDE